MSKSTAEIRLTAALTVLGVIVLTAIVVMAAVQCKCRAKKAHLKKSLIDTHDAFDELMLPSSPVIIPGVVKLLSTHDTPYVLLDAYIDGVFTQVRLTTTWAGLYVPDKTNQSVKFEFATARLLALCSHTALSYHGVRALISDNVKVTTPPFPSTEAVLGLGPQKIDGVYLSPVLAELAKRGHPVRFVISEANARVIMAFTIPEGTCFNYCWTPMTSTTSYLLKLEASKDEPWTSAVLDFGRWHSLLPGRKANNESLQLRTSAGCSFFLQVGTYKTSPEFKPTCIMGTSAGFQGSVSAFDLSQNRFGIVPVIVPTLSTSVFKASLN